MRILHNLVITLVVTLNSIELSLQSDRVPNGECIAGPSSHSGSPPARTLHAGPLHARTLHAGPLHAGPSSLVITFGQPEPHGELIYQAFSYPLGFQAIDRLTGDFMPIPTGHPFLSLTTANGYVLGLLDQGLVFFGIYAEFDGKLHRFKIPIEGGRPVLMRPEEVREFNDFRQF